MMAEYNSIIPKLLQALAFIDKVKVTYTADFLSEVYVLSTDSSRITLQPT
jgi:hypothetical protein